MARIRTIKPEFWQDEKLAPLDALTRLVFLGLISQADDTGRLVDSVKLLDGLLFPMTDDSCGNSLETLADLGIIERGVTASGQAVIQIRNWNKHQKIEKPNFSSALPEIVVGETSGKLPRRVPPKLRQAIYDRDGGVCQTCGSATRLDKKDRYDSGPDLAEIDHILALADGGTNDPQNLQLLCLACNRKKAGEAVRRRNAEASGNVRGNVGEAYPPHTNDHGSRTMDHGPTTSSPVHAHESLPGFEEEDAARLVSALQEGKVLDPLEFVYGISKAIGISHGDKAADAWHAMPSAKRTDWLLVAWEKALTAKAKVRRSYIAGVIGSALVDGIDLAAPVEHGSCAPPPLVPPPIDPQLLRDRLCRQLAPLLIRSGMARPAAEAFLRDSPTEALEARLAELTGPPATGGGRGAA